MQGTRRYQRSINNAPIPLVSKDDYRDVIESIYRNQYFTNHGPLAKQFESGLESFLDIDSVVSVGNESLALLIALAGLELKGEIIVPALGGRLPAQIAKWLNLEVRTCDVSATSHQPTMTDIVSALTEQTQAIVLVETWGHRCEQQLVEELASSGLKIVIVAFDSFGANTGNRYVVCHPNVTTVFSFSPGKTLSTIQGGAIATSDDQLAERFRNTRSSYGVRQKMDVKATCNGRFSELQAGIGIKSLNYQDKIVQRNREITASYLKTFENASRAVRVVTQPSGTPNYQCFPVQFATDPTTESCDSDIHVELIRELGIRRCEPLNREAANSDCPIAKRLVSQTYLMPVASCVDVDAAAEIAEQFLATLLPNRNQLP